MILVSVVNANRYSPRVRNAVHAAAGKSGRKETLTNCIALCLESRFWWLEPAHDRLLQNPAGTIATECPSTTARQFKRNRYCAPFRSVYVLTHVRFTKTRGIKPKQIFQQTEALILS